MITLLLAASTFCNPMSIPNMPVGIISRDLPNGTALPEKAGWRRTFWFRGSDVKPGSTRQFRELADPVTYVEGNRWYLYPSCGLMWTSDDCGGTWTHVPVQEKAGYAPAVAKCRGKYYMATSGGPISVADSPTGPWTTLGPFDLRSFGDDPQMPGTGDPALLADGDRLYLYWGCVAYPKALWGVELDLDNPRKAKGRAKCLMEYDQGKYPWLDELVEGAWAFKRGDTYYLAYSTANASGPLYSWCCLKSDAPLGEFTHQKRNPFFVSDRPLVNGTGHGSIWEDAAGDWWINYCIHVGAYHGFERLIGQDRIAFDADGDIEVGGASDTPQWLPSSGRKGPTGWRALDLEGGPKEAVDGRYRTWWTAEKLPAVAEYVFAGPRQLRAMRLIWRDLGLDVVKGVKPGAYRYRVEALVNAQWTTWIDASQNATDLYVDYREGESVKAEAVRLEILSAPKGMTAAVTEFTVFAEPLAAEPRSSKPSHFTTANATREIRAWRGETVDFPLPEGAKLGIAPAGFAVRVGTLRKVEYRVPPSKPLRMKSYFGYGCEQAYDRVEWDVLEKGPHYGEIAVPADAKPGVYEIGDITLTVVDRVLPPPSEWKYYLDLWQHPWAVARWFGVKPFSKEHYAKMEPLWRQLAAAGQKVLTTTLIDQPWNHQCYDAYGPMIRRIHNRSGSVSFDYSLFDEYVAFGRRCGIGPDVACYTMCPWSELVSWEDADGKLQRKKVSIGSQEFKDYWCPFLACFEQHLKEKGWLGHVAIAMDERSPEDMRKISAFIREQAPGLKITLAGNRRPSEFTGVSLDCYSQELNHTTPEFLAEIPARRQAGQVTTFYVCCGPWQPNTFLFSDPDDAYWLGYYPAAAGLDGFLRWAYNSWPEDPFKSAAFKLWSSGDTYFVYPNGDPSTRLLLLRKGIAAAEKCRVLKAKGLFADELKALAKKYDYKTAVKKENGDFAALVAETEALLNADCDSCSKRVR